MNIEPLGPLFSDFTQRFPYLFGIIPSGGSALSQDAASDGGGGLSSLAKATFPSPRTFFKEVSKTLAP